MNRRDEIEVSVAADDVRVPIASARVEALARRVLRAEGVRAASLSITFVRPARIAAMNREYLGHRGPTDVITFELARLPGAPIGGDVYIAPAVARENAERFRTRVRDEIARLVVHGVLHTLGYEHPEGDERETSEMWRRQERLLARHWPAAAATR